LVPTTGIRDTVVRARNVAKNVVGGNTSMPSNVVLSRLMGFRFGSLFSPSPVSHSTFARQDAKGFIGRPGGIEREMDDQVI